MMLWVMTGMMPLGNASDDASGDASGDALGDALGDDWVGAAAWLATGRSPDGSQWSAMKHCHVGWPVSHRWKWLNSMINNCLSSRPVSYGIYRRAAAQQDIFHLAADQSAKGIG